MSCRARFWIAEVRISEAHEAKIRERRFVTPAEIREAVVPDCYENARWEDHPDHGRRLLVIGRTHQGKRLKVVLEPIDEYDGIWLLRTVLLARS